MPADGRWGLAHILLKWRIWWASSINIIIIKKRSSEISLNYSAKSLNSCCVLKVSYECLIIIIIIIIIIQCEETRSYTMRYSFWNKNYVCLMRFIFTLHELYKVVFYADETVRRSAALFTRSRRHKFDIKETISYLQSCIQWIDIFFPTKEKPRMQKNLWGSATGLIKFKSYCCTVHFCRITSIINQQLQ